MSVIDELILANQTYTSNFTLGELPIRPARKVAVLTCMDARMDPMAMLGLAPGDGNVIRNAGGRARDAIRSLALCRSLLGVEEIAVIHHTECGSIGVTNAELRERMVKELGEQARPMASNFDFQPFTDLEESVREDVAFIRESPLIPGFVSVRGFIYDVRDGSLREID